MAQISKEYAEALFALACEEGKETEFLTALERIEKILEEQPDYAALLSSPSIPLNERLEAVEAALADGFPKYVISWVQLLCEKGRISCLKESIDEYKALLDESERISKVKVTSATPLTDEEKRKLVSKLEQKEKRKVSAEYFVDSALLGGLIVEVDGKIMDGSVRQRLHDVKEVITG